MSYARALRVLGIADDDGLTRTTLRRLYLRKLKDHPPEKDPDGFRALREAFELLREHVDDDPVPNDAPVAPPAVMVVDAAAPVVTPKAEVFSPPAPPHMPLGAIATEPPRAPLPPLAPLVPRATEPPRAPLPPLAPRATEPPCAPLPPLAPRATEPPLQLPALVTKLLELLTAGLVDAARALERDWRTKVVGDDHREATGLLAARWSLLCELLGVVADLPIPVTKLLAKALAEGDLAGARLSLIVYGREHAIEAELAADLLAKRAPNIFKPIENTLFVPRPKPPMPTGGVFGYGLDFMRAMADKNKRR